MGSSGGEVPTRVYNTLPSSQFPGDRKQTSPRLTLPVFLTTLTPDREYALINEKKKTDARDDRCGERPWDCKRSVLQRPAQCLAYHGLKDSYRAPGVPPQQVSLLSFLGLPCKSSPPSCHRLK